MWLDCIIARGEGGGGGGSTLACLKVRGRAII